MTQGTNVATNFLSRVRHRYHPFHRLKKNRFISAQLMPRLDRPLWRRLYGIGWPVRLRLMRHLSYIIDNRTVEPGVAALFEAVCDGLKPDVFWDVGANIGLYSWLVLTRRAEARAVLFEPDPENLAMISATKERSNIKRAEIIAVAAADKEGVLEFILDQVSGFTGGLDLAQETYVGTHYGLQQRRIQVPALTLDACLVNHPAPGFVKIDVEGAEHLVFAGAKRLLEDVRPVLIFECAPENFPALTGRLNQLDYQLFSAEEPETDVAGAPNILALPAGGALEAGQLMVAWHGRMKDWKG
ncbi:MAG: FkbM family methyltransferase [Rhodospirillales bacterium]|jgi:FkbM family methyltransferase|nr:hypothetical protein [Rhodospirillaceae bacterium]MDP6428870.1 FkbM family methyltransferase [Rhodospirillales bacterium]MDP6644757.1 FkbM family methyltransferase [Rhodospirillales bacterium]MDP6840489.1 FkbM family methyltransferase [Rhodospirillales bacterium]|tara:strand:- start:981 stop:1877 length:897 start_codon:yes stop_codon:yes gene_type:complete